MKIFVIDFSPTNFISEKLDKKHQVFTEKKDGQLAYKTIGEILPDIIFVNYSHKPSHGRQTAQAIIKRRKTADIPIYFVDGTEQDNEKTELLGQTIKFGEIENYLTN